MRRKQAYFCFFCSNTFAYGSPPSKRERFFPFPCAPATTLGAPGASASAKCAAVSFCYVTFAASFAAFLVVMAFSFSWRRFASSIFFAWTAPPHHAARSQALDFGLLCLVLLLQLVHNLFVRVKMPPREPRGVKRLSRGRKLLLADLIFSFRGRLKARPSSRRPPLR